MDFSLDEHLEEIRIDFTLPDFVAEDVEGFFEGDGRLVGPVGGGQGVKDVGDGHHPGLGADFIGIDSARVAAAVELFVVAVSYFRDLLQLARPGDLGQEVERVCDVAFDLEALVRGEGAFWDAEDLVLLAAQQHEIVFVRVGDD